MVMFTLFVAHIGGELDFVILFVGFHGAGRGGDYPLFFFQGHIYVEEWSNSNNDSDVLAEV